MRVALPASRRGSPEGLAQVAYGFRAMSFPLKAVTPTAMSGMFKAKTEWTPLISSRVRVTGSQNEILQIRLELRGVAPWAGHDLSRDDVWWSPKSRTRTWLLM